MTKRNQLPIDETALSEKVTQVRAALEAINGWSAQLSADIDDATEFQDDADSARASYRHAAERMREVMRDLAKIL
jgi:ABC-type transporter Mla subunit MlaD